MREQLFACEPTYLLGYLERLENASEQEIKLAAQMFGEDETDEDELEEETDEEGNVRVKIEGPLSMSGPSPIARLFGVQGTSYNSIVAWTKDCRRRRPRSVAIEFNSPGGDVAGADLAFQAIRALASEVPTRAEVSGMCASAAYWLAAACPQIQALSPAAEVGSIGVKIVAIDDSGLRDAIGIKKVTIVSRNAPKKAEDVATKAGRDVLQERADAMEAVFIARIAEGRKTTVQAVEADYGRGALLIASEAKRVGMIDAIQDSMTPRSPAASLAAAAPGVLVAQTAPASAGPKEKPMTLKELLATDPAARAEYDAALKAEYDKGATSVQARIAAAKPYLALQATKDGYDAAEVAQIAKCAVDVIAGSEDPGALRGFVRMVDMQVEQRKHAAAQAETDKLKETPGQDQPVDAAAIRVRAQALKIDVAAVEASAKAHKIDPIKALQAEVEIREQAARDAAAIGG